MTRMVTGGSVWSRVVTSGHEWSRMGHMTWGLSCALASVTVIQMQARATAETARVGWNGRPARGPTRPASGICRRRGSPGERFTVWVRCAKCFRRAAGSNGRAARSTRRARASPSAALPPVKVHDSLWKTIRIIRGQCLAESWWRCIARDSQSVCLGCSSAFRSTRNAAGGDASAPRDTPPRIFAAPVKWIRPSRPPAARTSPARPRCR